MNKIYVLLLFSKTQDMYISLFIRQLHILRGKKHYDQNTLKMAVEVKNIMTLLPNHKKQPLWKKKNIYRSNI